VQRDGKVLIAGEFQYVSGVRRDNLARLNTDGTLDQDFVPGEGAYPIILQPDDKIIAGGYVRLNTDGSVDTTFHRKVRGHAMALQSDGKVLIGGGRYTDTWNTVRIQVMRSALTRLNPDGSIDTTFWQNPRAGANDWVMAMEQQSDGKVPHRGDLYQS